MIPADAYRVEKTGDEKSGFTTKVVFTKDENDSNKKPSADPSTDDNNEKNPPKKKKDKYKTVDKSPSADTDRDDKSSDKKNPQATKYDEKWATLPRKERQKLKRKARQEEAKERKRLKKEAGDKTCSSDAAVAAPKVSKTASSSKDPSHAANNATPNTPSQQDQVAITQLQTTWSISAPGVSLHDTLCKGLHALNYTYPTPIQSSTLPAAILGRRDIVGAAPTGSGKTLSYGLPILQHLLDTGDASAADVTGDGNQTKLPLQALILTPTRELAIQVTDELKKVCCKCVSVGTIVGGFAEVKQRRTLEKVRPPIIVGTPGRLWELVSLDFCLVACVQRCVFEEWMVSMKIIISPGLDSLN